LQRSSTSRAAQYHIGQSCDRSRPSCTP
jgi:hypothetical protein